jgi:hypothetical protein
MALGCYSVKTFLAVKDGCFFLPINDLTGKEVLYHHKNKFQNPMIISHC